MIRINLLGQTRPKTARRPVDTGAAMPLVFVGAGVLFAALILFYVYHSYSTQLDQENSRIKQLQAQKTELEQIKLQVEAFEKQKQTLQQRVGTIEQLQKDRTGGQELLDQVARMAGVLRDIGVTKGDRVVIYMPMIPEAAISMLACAATNSGAATMAAW